MIYQFSLNLIERGIISFFQGFHKKKSVVIFYHIFLPPGRSPRLKRKQNKKSRPVLKEKGWWLTFGKVGPIGIGCLHSSEGTEEERNEVRGRVTRVNSTNVLDEGLRIGEIGRRMNSKVKLVEIGVYQK
jgi:hypothetical protein